MLRSPLLPGLFSFHYHLREQVFSLLKRKTRLCIDYCGLNDITIKNRCPLLLYNKDFLLSLIYVMHNTLESEREMNGRLLLILPHGIIKMWLCHLVDVLWDMLNVFVYLDDILIVSSNEECQFSFTKEPIACEGWKVWIPQCVTFQGFVLTKRRFQWIQRSL